MLHILAGRGDLPRSVTQGWPSKLRLRTESLDKYHGHGELESGPASVICENVRLLDSMLAFAAHSTMHVRRILDSRMPLPECRAAAKAMVDTRRPEPHGLWKSKGYLHAAWLHSIGFLGPSVAWQVDTSGTTSQALAILGGRSGCRGHLWTRCRPDLRPGIVATP